VSPRGRCLIVEAKLKGTDLFFPIYNLQNFFTRSPEIVAFSQLLPSLGTQSRRMVITLSANL
jgi:hypothetical protein